MAKDNRSWDIKNLVQAYETETGESLSRQQVARYLKEGILPPPDEGGSFNENHLERLRMIGYLRSRYGLSLRDISGLFGIIEQTREGTAGEEAEEPQVTDRRDRIIEIATRLFAAKGYHGTTIDEIVQATGIAKGTFYIYFDSKEELLVEVIRKLIDDTLGRIDRALEQRDEKDYIARIEAKGEELFNLYLTQSELLYMLLGETVGNPRLLAQFREVYEQLAEGIEEDLRLGVGAGDIFPYHDLKTVSYALVGMGQSIAVLLAQADEKQVRAARKTVRELMTRAFAPEHGSFPGGGRKPGKKSGA
ncbi:MAG: TetR family transcriptional regulator [Actinobacteria bacterium]|nr:TetR family transcriptional regulator [Actinomycetota bacterium]MDI6831144.1 TetR family transcriptional regulator [Actinomycetota bacterium]